MYVVGIGYEGALTGADMLIPDLAGYALLKLLANILSN